MEYVLPRRDQPSSLEGGCPISVPGFGTCVQHEVQLSNQTGRKTLCSSAKRDRRTSGPRERLPGFCPVSPNVPGTQRCCPCNLAAPAPHLILLSPFQFLSTPLTSHKGTWSSWTQTYSHKLILSPLPKTSFPHSLPTSTSDRKSVV